MLDTVSEPGASTVCLPGRGLGQFVPPKGVTIRPGMAVPYSEIGRATLPDYNYARSEYKKLQKKYIASDPLPGLLEQFKMLAETLIDWIKSGAALKSLTQMMTFDFPGAIKTQAQWGQKILASPRAAGYRPPRELKGFLEELFIATYRLTFFENPNFYLWPEMFKARFINYSGGTLNKAGFGPMLQQIQSQITFESIYGIGTLAFERNPGDARILNSLPVPWGPAPSILVGRIVQPTVSKQEMATYVKERGAARSAQEQERIKIFQREEAERRQIGFLATAYGRLFSIDPYVDYRDSNKTAQHMRSLISTFADKANTDAIFQDYPRKLFVGKKVWFTAGALPGQMETQQQKALKVLASVEKGAPTPSATSQCQGVVDSVPLHIKNAKNILNAIRMRLTRFNQAPADTANVQKLSEAVDLIKKQGVPAFIRLARKLRECKREDLAKQVDTWRAASERDANDVNKILLRAAVQDKAQQKKQATFLSQCNTAVAAFPSHLKNADNAINKIKMRHAVFNQDPNNTANNQELTKVVQFVKKAGIQNLINLTRQYRTCNREDLARQIEGKRVEVERTANAALGALMIEAARRKAAATTAPQLPVTTL